MSKPIKLRGVHVGARMSAHEFLKSFEKAIRDGYTLLDKPRGLEIPSFAGIPYCFIVKAGETSEDEVEQPEESTEQDEVVNSDEIHALTKEGEIVETTPIELVKAATKKDALLKLAEEFGIVVPEDKKVPAAIKQYLLDQLNSNQSE